MASRASVASAAALLFVVAVAFWGLEIRAGGGEAGVLASQHVDLFVEHYPMARFTFEALAAGSLPRWNPHQLCGVPHLATPFIGAFYPGNWIYLVLDTAVATEVSLVAHLLFAGICTWLLVRRLGMGFAAGLAAALTFMLSGWMIHKVNLPALVSGMCWLPFTVLMTMRCARGRRLAIPGLALAVGLQLLNGAAEFLVYNLYTAGLFAAFLLAGIGRQRGLAVLAGRAAALLGAVALGVLLGAIQLLPSRELLVESARAGLPFSLDFLTRVGALAPGEYPQAVFSGRGLAAVGLLPLLGVGLGWSLPRQRSVWLFALLAAALAVSLAQGGALWSLYYRTPFGGTFRFPEKLLHVHAFAAALLAAIAIEGLEDRRARRVALWRDPGWCGAVLVAALGLVWLAARGTWSGPLLAGAALLAAFAATQSVRGRAGLVVLFVLLQALSLFRGGSEAPRLVARPGAFDEQRPLLDELGRKAGLDRVYLSPRFLPNPSLTQKQAMLRGLYGVTDYNALAPRDAEAFLRRAAGPGFRRRQFTGWVSLDAASQLRLLDLASTRFYVVRRDEELDAVLAGAAGATGAVRRVADEDRVRVYERDGALPRVSFVAAARVLDAPDVLPALADEGFDPRREVLLTRERDGPESGAAPGATGSTRIRVYEPERVAVDVDASGPGFVVLTDRHAPGWEATIDGRPAPIRRANGLFRAVAVPAGRSTLVFSYRAPGLALGAVVSALTALALVAFALWPARGSAASKTGTMGAGARSGEMEDDP